MTRRQTNHKHGSGEPTAKGTGKVLLEALSIHPLHGGVAVNDPALLDVVDQGWISIDQLVTYS